MINTKSIMFDHQYFKMWQNSPDITVCIYSQRQPWFFENAYLFALSSSITSSRETDNVSV